MADTLTVPHEAPDTQAEEEHNQAMLEKIGEVEPSEVGEEEQEDKFGGDYDKLRESYDQLEKKLGNNTVEDTQEDTLAVPEDVQIDGVDMSALQTEYTTNGELSDKSYKNLGDAGVDRATVDQYIAGQHALASQMGDTVRDSVGGAEEYGNMIEWARANMNDQELATYNGAVQSGSLDMAKLAAKGLRASYLDSVGSEGATYGGKSSGGSEGSDVYRSNNELTQAMKDPRYNNDHAYREDVRKKLERSDLFSGGRI